MPNSSIKLQEIIDDAQSLGDVSPALATGGFSTGPSLSIANDVMQALINGGPIGQAFNWKWNRFNVPSFPTISYQQDYFVPNLFKLGWLESAWASDVNGLTTPKRKIQIEVHKDLEVDYQQGSAPMKICWLPNDQLATGTWGQIPLGPQATLPSSMGGGFGLNFGNSFGGANGNNDIDTAASGLLNPGPYTVYTNPIGATQTPINPTTCITDPNGNLWLLTTYGICGPTEPAWPSLVSYPTPQSPSTAPTTIIDGTCVWTAINPKGQGFRVSPIPPQTGTVWLIQPVGQMRAPRFNSVQQTIEPIPDDYATHFKQGFVAECYRRHPDPKVRARYTQERQIWMEALDKAVRQADREMDDVGFYPGASLMDSGFIRRPSPDYPFWG